MCACACVYSQCQLWESLPYPIFKTPLHYQVQLNPTFFSEVSALSTLPTGSNCSSWLPVPLFPLSEVPPVHILINPVARQWLTHLCSPFVSCMKMEIVVVRVTGSKTMLHVLSKDCRYLELNLYTSIVHLVLFLALIQ